MATLVCFHAHPDDEAIGTGGTIARAASLGHRVVLVVATGGEYGEVPEDLADGESLTDRRREETMRSAEVLGISRVEFLGYSDSGMTGWDGNNRPEAFMNAPLNEAAERLASILSDERADVLTTYDWHGGYGHPDHIAVHRVGHRAAELAGTPNVYENTMNRDEMDRFIKLARETPSALPRSISPPGWTSPRGWTASVCRCRRTAARCRTRRSSCACRRTFSPLRSAPNGSSARARRPVCTRTGSPACDLT